MPRLIRSASILLSVGLITIAAAAQSSRPIPHPVLLPKNFEAAVANGTRTTTGEPGPNYWTNYSEYTIDATLSPDTKTLTGTSRIVYRNNSPDELSRLYVHLRQNLHSEGVVRNRSVEVTGGMSHTDVLLDGRPIVERQRGRSPGYSVTGTLMTIWPPSPVASGAEVVIDLSWTFRVPERGAPRMGHDGEVFFLAYWYPQMAVYDDVSGWKAEPYMGSSEFYMGYGDYDVSITVPTGWLIGATGELVNPAEVLPSRVRDRLTLASGSRDPVGIVERHERQAGISTATSPTRALTWRFRAENVRDFAFGTSNRYVWDAVHADPGDRGDDSTRGTLIHTFYRPDADSAWYRSAEFGQYSVESLSKSMTPYPWPHMTVVEGLISGGMEYPMITLIGGTRTDASLFGTTYHEIAHMWFPMIVGSDEKTYPWLEEGLTEFNESVGRTAFLGVDGWAEARRRYYAVVGRDTERESMRHGDLFGPSHDVRNVASYQKPALVLRSLMGFVGAEPFYEAFQEYANRWAFKHPQPYDFFNTFEDVLGQDLDWFWSQVFFETWTADPAIKFVESVEDGTTIVLVEDRGLTAMPTVVVARFGDGSKAVEVIPVTTWLAGSREASVTFSGGLVTEVELDPDWLVLDIDRANNVWPEETGSEESSPRDQ